MKKDQTFKRALAVTSALLVGAGAVPPIEGTDFSLVSSVSAEQTKKTETFTSSYINPPDLPTDNELLEGYFLTKVYGGGFSTFSSLNTSLDTIPKSIYDKLLPEITKLADGTASSSSIAVKLTLTYEQLGLASTATSEEVGAAIKSAINTNSIMDALLADNPYEMYWYDKTSTGGVGVPISYSTGSAKSDVTLTF